MARKDDDSVNAQCSSDRTNAPVFNFVNITSVHQVHQKRHRRLVRSNATRHSWKAHSTATQSIKTNKKGDGSTGSSPEEDDRSVSRQYHNRLHLDRLEIGLVDPFQTYPSQLDSAIVNRMVKYSESQLCIESSSYMSSHED
jgi:hypothetical protein